MIQENLVTDQQQLLQLLSDKSSSGYRSVDSLLAGLLFCGNRPRVCLLFGSGSITNVDFRKGLEAASSHIDFVKEEVSFAQISKFIDKIVSLDKERYNVLALVRGGGSGINEMFNTLERKYAISKRFSRSPRLCRSS